MVDMQVTKERGIRWVKGENYEVISPAPRTAWNEVARKDPHTLISQTPEWTDLICKSPLSQDASRLYLLPNGRSLVLPVAKRFGLISGMSILESPPYGWGIGGLLAPGGVTLDDISIVLNDLSRQPFLSASIRPNPLHGDTWSGYSHEKAIRIPRQAHVLDLEGGFEKVWKERFSGAARQNTRYAQRSGVVVESDTTGRLAPVFYSLFKQSIERWAAQQHEPVLLALLRNQVHDPLHKFYQIASHLGGKSRFWIASLHGQPAAGILVLQDENAYYTRGAMIKELAGPSRASYLLHTLAIEEACRSGCRYYHMGETGESPRLSKFKERFGARPYRYDEYRFERLPISSLSNSVKRLVKNAIGFRDVQL